ncbi:MAG TPA: glycosyltransferase [Solirubrobacteraceae bacterium]|nr:glycosyltransferase [Solirubrobacteraceae bacterium]
MSTLLVSSVGGHLAELHRLLPRLEGIERERVWVTFDTPQSRSVLDGEDVRFVAYTGPRDLVNVLRHSSVAMRMFAGRHQFSSVVSTGSGIALSFLPIARLRGAQCHYIESATRSLGPSLTGRMLSRLGGISLYSQYRQWARPPWIFSGSVFDTFSPGPQQPCARPIGRAVVTLGTMEDYEFRALLERALAVLPDGVEVLWQVGCTDVAGLPISAHRQLPARELRAAIAEADVVIAHAGCGSSLDALAAGKMPVLIPRRGAYGENVDDHHALIAEELDRRGLAVARSVERLCLDDLLLAARGSVRAEAQAPPFKLELRNRACER